jgi:hypothetical protein
MRTYRSGESGVGWRNGHDCKRSRRAVGGKLNDVRRPSGDIDVVARAQTETEMGGEGGKRREIVQETERWARTRTGHFWRYYH